VILETFLPFASSEDIAIESSKLNGYKLSDLIAHCRKWNKLLNKIETTSRDRPSEIEVVKWSDIGGHERAKVISYTFTLLNFN
jgi:hypothetical protein